MVVKIVNDTLVEMLGATAEPIDLNATPPVAILMVGLQGSGKTTTTAKIARGCRRSSGRRCWSPRSTPAARPPWSSFRFWRSMVEVDFLPIVAGQSAVQIARRAQDAARLGGYDVVMLDTAGRTTIDMELMAEVTEVKAVTGPHEVLLVADASPGRTPSGRQRRSMMRSASRASS